MLVGRGRARSCGPTSGGDGYETFWARELGPLDLHHWVNDGLMALFFFVVGLEIKRELVAGELRDRRAAALPAIAAVGGVVLPIAIFVALTAGGDGRRGLGDPGGHRHRLRGRRAGAARRPRVRPARGCSC